VRLGLVERNSREGTEKGKKVRLKGPICEHARLRTSTQGGPGEKKGLLGPPLKAVVITEKKDQAPGESGTGVKGKVY